MQGSTQLQALAAVLQEALLLPSMTLAVASCFRPMLLPLVDALVDQELSTDLKSGAPQVQVAVALISLLELAPYLARYAASICCFSEVKQHIHDVSQVHTVIG